jgi:ACS family glucarate transporter-like MFS transporter
MPWLTVALLMSFTFTNYVNRVAMADAGEDIRAEYGFSETAFGTVISAFLLAYTVCMIPGGWLSDRFGARVMLQAVALGTALLCGLTGLLGWLVPASLATAMLVLLWSARSLMGALTAPLFPAAGRVVTHCVPFGHRARINALVTGAAMLGVGASHPICGALIDAFGWRAAFVVLALVTAIVGIVWTVVGRDAPRIRHFPSARRAEPVPTDRDQVGGISWRGIAANRSLWLLTASYASVGYVEYVIFYWSADYFKKVLELSAWAERAAAMAPPLCMGVCIPLGGSLCDWLMPRVGYRLSRSIVAATGMVLSACALFVATVAGNDYLIVAGLSASLAMMGLTEAPAWATAIDLGGRNPGTSAALANTGGNLGGTISPTLTPWISAFLVSQFQFTDNEGWGWALRAAALVALAGSVLWIWIDAGERH